MPFYVDDRAYEDYEIADALADFWKQVAANYGSLGETAKVVLTFVPDPV